jgi:hypothetical protein
MLFATWSTQKPPGWHEPFALPPSLKSIQTTVGQPLPEKGNFVLMGWKMISLNFPIAMHGFAHTPHGVRISYRKHMQ